MDLCPDVIAGCLKNSAMSLWYISKQSWEGAEMTKAQEKSHEHKTLLDVVASANAKQRMINVEIFEAS